MGGKKNKNKACKNAFFFFMMELKQRQGFNFRNMEEVSQAASPLWNNMSAAERYPYEQMARREKNEHGQVKYTSQGVDIAVVVKQEAELRNKEQQVKQDTQKLVQLLSQTGALGNHEFYIVHINNFCYAHSHKKNYLAEIAVSRFNLLNGVNADKVFHRMIKPGPLPLGYSYEAKKNSEESHQIPPPWGQDVPDNTTEVFRELVAFLMENNSDSDKLPPLFTKQSLLPFVHESLETLSLECGDRGDLCKVYSLDYMLFLLKNAVAENQVWPVVSLSTEELERDVYDYTIEIACDFHRSIEAPVHCSKAIVVRLAYIICDNCCCYLDLDLIPGCHIPKKALVPTSATPSYAPSLADEEASNASYRPRPLSDYDRCSSTTSFVSTDAAFENDDFPPLGGNKHTDSSVSELRSDTQIGASRGFFHRRTRRPAELPSALTNRMEGLSVQPQPKAKGRGRGIVGKIVQS